MTSISIIVSIVLGFFFGEMTGWLTGGLVAPGYLALYIDQPLRILMTYMAALLAFFLIKLLAKITILFGRRRFMAFILAGICMGALLDAVVRLIPPSGTDLRAIGYVVPGLIANDIWKQGLWRTLLGSLVITLATRVVLLLILA
ncbi:MAG TPA: poly-gamma-glutamate biosynthesis protein PgsC [Rectinema sp.]|jgi:poly-gamma-glutamate biosynthesis protein PgsC/CapC|nr:poly-gamma-glutamate biosynthesis protein PgsC [Spirochaetia bacterium]NLH89233.1 poly-gamma-glutamate biosynthesis protein PgsC [Treponema sp.]OQC73112.1 MAG: Capsule biosynthesis protein CapC [Spirochaetes bacterium ADurb.Bin001]HNP93529.1 poly-gamma-glutamate biosynthesis protein PgsC [Rectinema sp.]HNV37218.1 poly-gamma-glutamate biosynthesis protein PgsC [Rectinema sp.]